MPRISFQKITQVFESTAGHKRDAQARFLGRPDEVERPRDVYLQACATIAESLSQVGFRYAKSAQRASRTNGSLTNDVSFQSSHNNIAGRHVCLWMHATVRSKALQRWRAERLLSPTSDYVAGGMVHLISDDSALLEWELADQSERPATIADAIAFIDGSVLPYFEQFENPKTLIERLAHHDVPAFGLKESVEFSACFGSTEAAQLVLDRFVRNRPELREEIAKAERDGRPAPPFAPANFAEKVSFLRRAYGLK